MYQKLMVPVDLAHTAALEKALTVAADLARQYQSAICYVGVCTTSPTEVAHNPDEFASCMERFSQQQAEQHQLADVSCVTCISHDPAADLNQVLIQAAEDNHADLVVMASHLPGIVDHIFTSHAGYLASHCKLSVLIVR